MRKHHEIKIKRVYDEPAPEEFLVDRLWPRGLRKDTVPLKAWLKDVAPSAELRKWFGHEPEKWKEFCRRYRKELAKNADALATLQAAMQEGTITLLFSAKDPDKNQATVLKKVLEEDRLSFR